MELLQAEKYHQVNSAVKKLLKTCNTESYSNAELSAVERAASSVASSNSYRPLYGAQSSVNDRNELRRTGGASGHYAAMRLRVGFALCCTQ